MTPLGMEIIRQLLRWLAVWLVTVGLPEDAARLVEHPETVALAAAAVSYALADAGWLVAKLRERFR